jgi:putative endonuclease
MWWYVYILKSLKNGKIYIGFTDNLKRRLTQHNAGLNISTKRDLPWEIVACFAVKSEVKAREFERYLKSGSGRAMIRKRIT